MNKRKTKKMEAIAGTHLKQVIKICTPLTDEELKKAQKFYKERDK